MKDMNEMMNQWINLEWPPKFILYLVTKYIFMIHTIQGSWERERERERERFFIIIHKTKMWVSTPLTKRFDNRCSTQPQQAPILPSPSALSLSISHIICVVSVVTCLHATQTTIKSYIWWCDLNKNFIVR